MALRNWLNPVYVSSVATIATPATAKPLDVATVATVASNDASLEQIYPKAVMRLKAAAKNLPVTLEELLIFYLTDLVAFEANEVPQHKINFAVKLYAQTYKGYQPFENKEAG